MPPSPDITSVQSRDAARALLEAAEIDTVHRDVYLRRAREVLAPILSAEQYRFLSSQKQALAKIRRQLDSAVAARDWQRVKQLSDEAGGLDRAVASRAGDLGVAEAAYESPDVCIDPFSPGYEVVLAQRGQQPSLMAARGRDALLRLERLDREHAALYAERRSYLTGLDLVDIEQRRDDTGSDAAELERQAASLAAKGDVAALGRLAERLLQRRDQPATAAAPHESELSASVCPVDLTAAFPAEAVERARALGLSAHRLTTPRQTAARDVLDEVYRNAWHPSFRGATVAYEGVRRLERTIAEANLSSDLAKGMVELANLFVLHPYVNSGGGRYLPGFGEEAVLLEDHPEGEAEERPSDLLAALELPRRRALARMTVERALLERGASILAGRLGLDPVEFKLVCIPFDAYVRIGAERGWGRLERHWTHFDGYEVVPGPAFRALCGGDARYGGLFDLVSISPDDERESVQLRLAIVRRARLVARWR